MKYPIIIEYYDQNILTHRWEYNDSRDRLKEIKVGDMISNGPNTCYEVISIEDSLIKAKLVHKW